MGSYAFEVSREIDAPIDRVWEYLVSHDEWRRPFIESVRKLSDGVLEVGTRYENRGKLGPRELTLINEITELDPPHRLGWRQVNTDAPVVTNRGTYTLEQLDDRRTRFTLSVRSTTNGLASILAPVMPWMAKRVMGPKLMGQLEQGIAQTQNV
ncbi:MAG: SRPBCC family protein [Actinomycetota bacterium]